MVRRRTSSAAARCLWRIATGSSRNHNPLDRPRGLSSFTSSSGMLQRRGGGGSTTPFPSSLLLVILLAAVSLAATGSDGQEAPPSVAIALPPTTARSTGRARVTPAAVDAGGLRVFVVTETDRDDAPSRQEDDDVGSDDDHQTVSPSSDGTSSSVVFALLLGALGIACVALALLAYEVCRLRRCASAAGGGAVRSVGGHDAPTKDDGCDDDTDGVMHQVKHPAFAVAGGTRDDNAGSAGGGRNTCSWTDARVDAVAQLLEAGKWSRGRFVGRGSSGAVYHSLLPDGTVLAVKQAELPAGDARRALRSIQRLTRLRHPNVVQHVFAAALPPLAPQAPRTKDTTLSSSLSSPAAPAAAVVLHTWMEYMAVGSLGAMVRALNTHLAEPTAAGYVAQLLQGLAFLHDKGLAHRDIKADNILLAADGTVGLADMGHVAGVANGGRGVDDDDDDGAATTEEDEEEEEGPTLLRQIDDDGPDSCPSLAPMPQGPSSPSSSSAASSIGGTPLWIAPELLRGWNQSSPSSPPPPPYDSRPLSAHVTKNKKNQRDAAVGHDLAAADIWSVGITVGEILDKGRPPWPEFASPWQALFYVGRPGAQPEVPAHVSADARDFVLRCVQRDPARRPSAAALLRHPWLMIAHATPSSSTTTTSQPSSSPASLPHHQLQNRNTTAATTTGCSSGGCCGSVTAALTSAPNATPPAPLPSSSSSPPEEQRMFEGAADDCSRGRSVTARGGNETDGTPRHRPTVASRPPSVAVGPTRLLGGPPADRGMPLPMSPQRGGGGGYTGRSDDEVDDSENAPSSHRLVLRHDDPTSTGQDSPTPPPDFFLHPQYASQQASLDLRLE